MSYLEYTETIFVEMKPDIDSRCLTPTNIFKFLVRCRFMCCGTGGESSNEKVQFRYDLAIGVELNEYKKTSV